MSLEDILGKLKDPFHKEGYNIENKIIEKFLYATTIPLVEARDLAIKYAKHQIAVNLNGHGSTSEEKFDPEAYDYSMWSRAVSDGKRGNWQTLARNLREVGEILYNDPGESVEYIEAGQSLINLANSLL